MGSNRLVKRKPKCGTATCGCSFTTLMKLSKESPLTEKQLAAIEKANAVRFSLRNCERCKEIQPINYIYIAVLDLSWKIYNT
jgi:hypothetical protein